MSADPRDELLRQIRAIRRRIDPEVLARAAKAAETAQAGPRPADPSPTGPSLTGPSSSELPYDRDAARAAVEMFLQARHDGGQFAMRLIEALKRPDAAARAYGTTAAIRPSEARKI